MEILYYHTIAFILGIILDLIVGDPYSIPHPIRLIGKLIGSLDTVFLGDKTNVSTNPSKEKRDGILIVVITVFLTAAYTTIILMSAYLINSILGIIVEAVLIFYTLAAKSLCVESMKVYKDLDNDDLNKARVSVSMIVGRDTMNLDKEGVAKAAVETVAENTSDGVIAPLLYAFIGGPVLSMTYKAVNTMDSMIGYHSDRYEYLGKAAARLDDIVNYIPSRLSAYLMIAAAFILGLFSKEKVYDWKRAYAVFKRDRFNHKSPNSAQTESVAAGALGIRLAGDAYYFGKLVKKPYIGDKERDICLNDIKRVNRLMFLSEIILATFGIIINILLFILIR